ncbi:MAG: hypothetical protein HY430_00530 [Candidatus Levybacteria bacterium]|nr:hypothetical protein [Candidatus Levybacteria bacterium]
MAVEVPKRKRVITRIGEHFGWLDTSEEITARIDEYGGSLSVDADTEQGVCAGSFEDFFKLAEELEAQRVEAQVRTRKGETLLEGVLEKFEHAIHLQAVGSGNQVVTFERQFGSCLGSANAISHPSSDTGSLRTYITAGSMLIYAKERLPAVTTCLTSENPETAPTREYYQYMLQRAQQHHIQPW